MSNMNFSVIDSTNRQLDFTSLESLRDFLKKEQAFWRVPVTQIPTNQYQNFKNFPNTWDHITNTIDHAIENIKSADENTITSNANGIRNQLRSADRSWLWSGHTFIDAWIESYKLGVAAGDAFLECVAFNQFSRYNNFESLKGYILGYEFLLQDESSLTKRRNTEEKSFNRLRNQLSEKKDELITQTSQFQEGIIDWKNATQGEYSEWHKLTSDSLNDAETTRANDFNTQLNEWHSKIEKLEKLYGEKLRIEKPAQYWATRAISLKKQGYWFGGGLAALILIGIVYFTYLFTQWLSGKEIAMSLHSFQGAVLLTVIISSFVFLIRILSRLTFSAFHLQRDAEEREQLAHVYLSLVNEAKADDESRKIILQSLFSRAETGLLNGETGPTMPISDFVNPQNR